MPTRRTHTKSRKGCQECKRRKVKCDEKPPSCFNCARRGVVCSLSGLAVSLSSPRSPHAENDKGTAVASSGTGSDDAFDLTSIEAAHDLRLSPQAGPSIIERWGQSMELIHHYSTVTANSLAHRPDMQHVWRVVVPGIAYANHFLMHGILAIAAMHQSHLVVSQRQAYADLAVYHQTIGLKGFREALHRLSSVGDCDWKPSFCFSAMMILGMCWHPGGSPSRSSEATSSGATPDALDVFIFIKGVKAVLQPFRPHLPHTNLSPLAAGGRPQQASSSTFDPSLLRFSLLPSDILEAIDSSTWFYKSTLDGQTRNAYVDAMDHIRKSVYMVAEAGAQPESRTVMAIPYLIEENVRVDIMAHSPHAMIFLSHFAVLVRVLERIFWYFSGLAKRLFAVIDESLARFPVHLDAVKWQRKQVFETYET